ncbi:MAG: hypothetical protein QW087_01385 [Methanomassiliicoccales archaeon]
MCARVRVRARARVCVCACARGCVCVHGKRARELKEDSLKGKNEGI